MGAKAAASRVYILKALLRVEPRDAGAGVLATVRGRPLIVSHIVALVRAGIGEIIVSTAAASDDLQAALGDDLQAALGDGSRFGAHLKYAPAAAGDMREAITAALPLLGSDPFIALPAHLYCPHFDFEEAKSVLEDCDVLGNPYTPEQRDIGWLYLLKNGGDKNEDGDGGRFGLQLYTVQCEGAPRYAFSGIGVYRPELFAAPDDKPGERPANWLQLLRMHAARGRLGGELYPGPCSPVDTLSQLQMLNAPPILLKGMPDV